MKKLFSLLVPLLALFLTLSPQSMLADNPDYFTITNVHATQATAVHLLRSNSYAPSATLTFRILDKDDNVVLDWTTKTFSTTGTSTSNSTRFGSSTDVIPADGGKMQIYGNNSSGLGYTGGDTPYLRFVLVNGSQELSGNILSLVACSDGQTINNNFTLPTRCFKSIFQNCSTVVSAENLKLPSMTLSNSYQYQSLFQNCVNMVKGPKELPATAASGTGVYNSMFRSCSKLEESPDIKAATWGTYGLNNMFNSCTLLKKIRIHTTKTSLSDATTWVNAVASTGEFYCPPTLTRTFVGASANKTNCIPLSSSSKWTVYSYNVTFVLQAGTWEDATSANKQFTWETDVDNVTDFLDTEAAADAVFYESDGVTPVTIATIKSRLSTQQESSSSITKTYYVKKLATFHITFKDNGGTTRYEQDILEGEMPSYGGASLDQVGYKLIWSPALYAADKDQIYTATYSLLYNFTASAGEHGTVQLTAADYADAENSSAYASGTSVQMTVVPNDGYRFVRWSDDGAGNTDNPRTVTTTSSASSYTAELEVIPTHYARFYDEDGTTLKYEVAVREGSTPVYAGPALTKQWHFFDGWTPAITAMGASDVAYTAVYVREPDYFTITNKGNAATTINIYRTSSSSQQPVLKVRISDAEGNITTSWTTIAVNISANTYKQLGSIPAGGKMEIYGNNSSGFSTYNYRVQFAISSGQIEISGDILSLVACSDDGKTINDDFSLPAFCFNCLFSGVTTLVSAKNLVLPSTTLSEGAYHQMFSGCSALANAPKVLPATVMPPRCYYQMFQNCTALTKSPDIYGQTLTGSQGSVQNGAEASMFSGCTNLSHIRTYLATQWTNQTYHTSYWVNNVQKTAGSFYCPRTLNRETGGHYCIPSSNWTIYSYNVTFVPVGGNWSDDTDENKQFTWRTDVGDVEDLLTSEAERVTGYYSDALCTIELDNEAIHTILTTRPSNDNTTYIYAKISATSSYALDWDANEGALSGVYTAAGDYEEGATITEPTATRAGYTHTGWLPEFTGTMPSNDVTYVAQWSTVTYDLTYEGLNGATNSNPATYTVETATITLANPGTRAGYTFTGWTCGGNPITQITLGSTGDKTITANWTVINYTLTWTTDGDALTGTYTSGSTAYGTTIVAPNTPTKTGYTFKAWTPAVAETMPAANTEYTATWTATTYNLTYEGLNGATNTNPATYTIESETITLAAPGTRDGYVFTGWTINGTPVTEITHGSTGDKTITANWNAKLSSITLEDNRENSFYNTFKTTYDGESGLIVTYERQFTAGRWSTLCLPFSVNKAMFSSLNFGSRIYEFKYATGNADDGVNLYFSIAKSIEAGKGYIVNADAKLAARTSFTFSGVTMDLSADNGAELNSVTAYDNLTGSSSEGNIELVGTLRKGTLKGSAADNRYMGLKENKIYYPNIATGSTILAYRGIFRSIDGTLNAERIRIIVDGEEKAELEVINGELQDVQETKKFIENGVLYIKRNGIIYDTTGRKVE